MDPIKLRPRIPSPHPKPPRPNHLFLFVSSAISLVLFLYLLFSPDRSNPLRFSIVIDAGSTGTRIHVFAYKAGSSLVPEIDLGSTAEMKVRPGLSSYAEDPEKAGESIVELVGFGKGKVPKDRWGETEVRLMATAGLRMVEEGARERILEACRKVLRGSGFRFQDEWANVISGSDEGIFAWVAANYASDSLGGDPEKTVGIIELGGASAQVTFVSSEPLPPEFSHALKFGEKTYNLYSNSFLHFGQNVAHHSVQKLLSLRSLKSSAEDAPEGMFTDPCSPRGYSNGAEPLKASSGALSSKLEYHPNAHAGGNFSECRSAALMLLQKEKDKCLYRQCHLGSNFVPKLQGKFLATENFFYTSKFFGLGPNPVLSDLIMAGQKFCEQDWLKLKKQYHILNEEDLPRYCFSSAYIVALLHDSLGIPLDDNSLKFANRVGSIQLDWALGAFIMQRTSNLAEQHSDWLTALVRNNMMALLSVCGMSAIFVVAVWLVLRWRRPQLKTVYDLEKGRYIVTRVNR